LPPKKNLKLLKIVAKLPRGLIFPRAAAIFCIPPFNLYVFLDERKNLLYHQKLFLPGCIKHGGRGAPPRNAALVPLIHTRATIRSSLNFPCLYFLFDLSL